MISSTAPPTLEQLGDLDAAGKAVIDLTDRWIQERTQTDFYGRVNPQK